MEQKQTVEDDGVPASSWPCFGGKKAEDKDALPPVSVGTMFQYAETLDYVLLFFGVIASVGVGAAQPVSIVLFADVMNAASGTMTTDISNSINDVVFKFLYLGAAAGVCGWTYAACFKVSGYRQAGMWRKQYLGAILRQDVEWFDVNNPNELPTKIAETTHKIEEGVSGKLGELWRNLSQGAVGLTVAFLFSWDMALIMVLLSPLTMVGTWILAHVTQTATKKVQSAYAKAGGVVGESLSGIRTIAALQGEATSLARYSAHLDDAKDASVKRSRDVGFANGLLFSSGNAMVAAGFIYGGFKIAKELRDSLDSDGLNCMERMDCDINGGHLLICMFSVQMGSQALGVIEPSWTAFMTARQSAAIVETTTKRVPKIDVYDETKKTLPSVKGDIEFKGVHFTYPNRPEKPIFQGLDLTVEAGKTVALVGQSGSGKSTTVQLIERFYDPSAGTVTLDGVDLRDLNVKWLRQQIGLVGQEPVLFAGTIAENIAYGKPGVDRSKIEQAARAANAHDFISDAKLFEKGYETDVGESGNQLSGGQKQRVAIARAIVKEPAILLLDEATSALDNESERQVQAALDGLATGTRTTIVIAHRLTTIRDADKIVVFKQGTICEQGSHQVLMDRHGDYEALVLAAEAADPQKEGGLKELDSVEVDATGALAAASGARPSLDQARVSLDKQRSMENPLGADKEAKEETKEEKKARKAREKAEAKEKAKLLAANKKRIWSLSARPEDYGLLALGGFAGSLAGAVNPFVGLVFAKTIGMFYMTDPDDMESEAINWSCVMWGTAVVQIASSSVMGACLGLVGGNVTRKLRRDTYEATLRQDIGWFDMPDQAVGKLAAMLSEQVALCAALTGETLGRNISFFATVVCGIGLSFGLGDPLLALVALALVPVMASGMAIEVAVISGSGGATEEGVGAQASRIVGEIISSVRTIASFTLEESFNASFKTALDGYLAKAKPIAVLKGGLTGYSQFSLLAAFSILYWFGGTRLGDGKISFEEMLITIFGLFMMAAGFGAAAADATDTSKAGEAAEKIFALMDRVPAIDHAGTGGQAPAGVPAGRLEFKGVRFTYPNRPESEVFRGFNLTVEAGKTVALVGASGSGKSTTVQLIERFYDPSAGTVTLDGVDLRDLNVKWLRQQIGLVGQEPVLFSGTIAENIAYGKDGCSRDEVEAAAKLANAHTFISAFPKGYDTHVGEGVSQLSGGEKQRVAIARAIVKEPPILLLDEATSALDNTGERDVQAALNALLETQKRTTLVIAHRLSTIRNADKIVVVEKGRVAEQGTHDQLVALNGKYKALQARMASSES